eukprot:TRINITY_DN110219_c0_g1_i1.p1 TRINITY_DN110219_c0_g1~~TRINITY_DN110219_c0_g1_i1.p1  ORF type:complete len:398 (-),score=40.44 TRINITY_DN110219_c0_g1_i1:13-1170(-)
MLGVCTLLLSNKPLLLALGAVISAAPPGLGYDLPETPARPKNLHLRLYGRYNLTRHIGESRFARRQSYHAEGKELLSRAQRSGYFRHGYLLLRGLVPTVTAASLREEILRTHFHDTVQDPYAMNAWMESDRLLDFLIFGPFGKVAAELFAGKGKGGVHLLRSSHRFEQRQPTSAADWHYDWAECEDGFPPASDVRRSFVKFYIALYNDMPAMWFVNQTALEALIAGLRSDGPALRSAFRKGLLHPPQGLCDNVHAMPCTSSDVPTLDRTDLERVSLKPVLQVGDVIVHSTTVVHRPPIVASKVRRGFLTAAYGPSDARFSGRHDMAAGNRRLCDTGVPIYRSRLPTLSSVPRPNCFPRVYPPPLAKADVNLNFRSGSHINPSVET